MAESSPWEMAPDSQFILPDVKIRLCEAQIVWSGQSFRLLSGQALSAAFDFDVAFDFDLCREVRLLRCSLSPRRNLPLHGRARKVWKSAAKIVPRCSENVGR